MVPREIIGIIFENNSTRTKNLKKHLYSRQIFYLFPCCTATLRKIWSQNIFHYQTPLSLGHFRRTPWEYAALKKLLWSAARTFMRRVSRLPYLFYLMIERMRRRRRGDDCIDNFTPARRRQNGWEDGGTIRWVTTWGLKRRLPSLPAKSDVINHSSNTTIEFLSHNQIERRFNNKLIQKPSVKK